MQLISYYIIVCFTTMLCNVYLVLVCAREEPVEYYQFLIDKINNNQIQLFLQDT